MTPYKGIDRRMETSDHDLLIRLDENVQEILRQMKDRDTEMVSLTKRIDILENFKVYILGIFAAVGFLVAYLFSYLSHHLPL